MSYQAEPLTYWTLEDALPLIRAIQPITRTYHFHLCLGGGVLNKGRSNKDRDLYFLPLNHDDIADVKGMEAWLTSVWGPPEPIGDDDYLDIEPIYKRKLKYTYSGLRIDVFILGEPDEKAATTSATAVDTVAQPDLLF